MIAARWAAPLDGVSDAAPLTAGAGAPSSESSSSSSSYSYSYSYSSLDPPSALTTAPSASSTGRAASSTLSAISPVSVVLRYCLGCRWRDPGGECASVVGAVLGAWAAWGSLPGVPMTAPFGEPAAALPLGLKIDATLSAGTNP